MKNNINLNVADCSLEVSMPSELKHGIFAHDKKPNVRDIMSIDGGFMSGYRKVKINNDIGYVMAGGVKFGHKDLSKFVGKYVYVDASRYWAITAIVGYGRSAEYTIMSGIKCGFLSDINK